VVKTLAFVIGVLIFAVGVMGVVLPSGLLLIAGRFVGPFEWYALAVVRILVGTLLLFVAKSSRSPRALGVVAFIPLLAGLAIPFVGVARARATVEAWSLQGPGVLRLSAVPVLVLGGFIAYACAPAKRAA
jgi:hypothetical protein